MKPKRFSEEAIMTLRTRQDLLLHLKTSQATSIEKQFADQIRTHKAVQTGRLRWIQSTSGLTETKVSR